MSFGEEKVPFNYLGTPAIRIYRHAACTRLEALLTLGSAHTDEGSVRVRPMLEITYRRLYILMNMIEARLVDIS